MVLVLALAAMLWGFGAIMKVPSRARWTMIGLLYVFVLALQVALPASHPVRMATGESPAFWLILGAFAALFVGYRTVLRHLRGRAQEEEAKAAPTPKGPFSDAESNRYARHFVLREVGNSAVQG